MNKFLMTLALAAVASAGIPVYLMLPLTTVDKTGLTNAAQFKTDFAKIKAGGITGVMSDVWWGLTETTRGKYNFTAYRQLAELAKEAGLKMQFVMSFHRCGGNVGDTCDFPLPSWVGETSAGSAVYYTDAEGVANPEYISLSVDDEALWGGKTALDLYSEFMSAFKSEFSDLLGSTIDGISVGLGPASELRYPSYPSDRWSYCGVGEFQCYEKHALEQLASAATAAGHSDWGYAGPNNAGTYKNYPTDTGFFGNGNDNYASDYGKFFLNWYSERLIVHGEKVLKIAKNIFGSTGVALTAKISGIHWWYSDGSHASELTAGYYNTNGNDAYYNIASRIGKYADTFDFTCLEMFNGNSCGSQPENLVKQAIESVTKAGMRFDGENALELCSGTCSQNSFDQIYKQATQYGKIDHFTYLRHTRNLLDNDNNWKIFTSFVSKMASA